jgi:hypothetical protein
MKYLFVLLCVLLGGCGHMFFPAVQRLSPEDQAKVDQIWNNVLTPPERVDRELLLDVVEAFELHTAGIDRLKLECEKDFTGGTVHMIVNFNRRRPPEDDRFIVMIRDHQGHLLRKETYSSEEVLSHGKQIFGVVVTGTFQEESKEAATQPSSQPATQQSPTTAPASRPLTEAEKADQAWREARWRQIRAATRPVGAPLPPED